MINALPKPFAGAFMMAIIWLGITMMLLCIVRWPDYHKQLTTRGIIVDQNIDNGVVQQQRRPWYELLGQRNYLIACLGGFSAWVCMGLPMSASTTAMIQYGYTSQDAMLIITYHVVAMFLPAIFSGPLIRRIGSKPAILLGLSIELLGLGLAVKDMSLESFTLCVTLVGIGWYVWEFGTVYHTS